MDSVATLLPCIEALCKDLALAPDAADKRRLLEADTQGAPEQMLHLLRGCGLRPRLIAGRQELPERYDGPLLAMIDRRSWVYVPAYGRDTQETLEIFDPRAGGAVTVSCAQFRQRWDGPAVLCVRRTVRPARRRPEGLQCLCVIGRHHGLDLDEARLAHSHAIDGDTISLLQLREIARDCGFTAASAPFHGSGRWRSTTFFRCWPQRVRAVSPFSAIFRRRRTAKRAFRRSFPLRGTPPLRRPCVF